MGNKMFAAGRLLPKNRLRILIAVLIILSLLFSLNVVSYAETIKTVPISYEGQILKNSALQYQETGALFLPLRVVSEALGYSVEWADADRSVTVKNKDKTVLFEPAKDTINDAGHSYLVSGLPIKGNDAVYGYIGGGCILVSDRIYVASDLMASIFGIQNNYDPTTNLYQLSVAPQGKATAENRVIYSEDSKLKTNIQYPHITVADRAVADKINAVILADVETAKKEAQDNLAYYGDSPSPNKSETYFNYTIAYQKGDLLSLVLWDYQYYGGAHGSTRQIGHTFDLKTGTEYTLADLMNGDSGYVGYINDTIKAKIVQDGMKDAQLAEFVSIANNQSYYLSDKGLVVYFQQYEYFPYAAGIMEYNLPYSDLNQYLKTEFQVN